MRDNLTLLWLAITVTFCVISTYILITFDKVLGVVGGFINISGVLLSIPILDYDDRLSAEEILKIYGVIELSLTFGLLIIKYIS